jgi:hypothetical protein
MIDGTNVFVSAAAAGKSVITQEQTTVTTKTD